MAEYKQLNNAEYAEDLQDSIVEEAEASANTEVNQKPKKKIVTARKDMTLAQWTWHEMKRNKIAYLMIAPFMFVFILFTVFPVVLSLVLSFTNFNMLELNWICSSALVTIQDCSSRMISSFSLVRTPLCSL